MTTNVPIATADPSSMQIEVWSDIACPWCWVGKRHLGAALAATDSNVAVRWRAFELNANARPAGPDPVDYVQKLATKYMTSRAQAQSMIDRMTTVGVERGLEFRFDRVRPGNTFDAHRLIAWSATQGFQSDVVERLFRAYMNEGLSVSDHDVLARIAGQAGGDSREAQSMLESEAFAAEVRADETRAGELGVTGVPFYLLGGRLAVQGAQPTETLEKAIEHAKTLEPLVTDISNGTEADGCSTEECTV